MGYGFFGSLVPAIVIVLIVLAFEEWAFFKSKTRFQRALITGAAVFVILLVIGLLIPHPGY